MKTKVKQHDMTDCAAACLTSVAAHYRLGVPLSKIRQYAGTDKKGTNALGLMKAAEKLGFSTKGVRAGLDSLSLAPCPAIAHVTIREILLHFVVIYRISKGKVRYMDPGDGEMHTATFEEFGKMWTGVLILLSPGENFQTGNQKVSVLRRFAYLLEPHKNRLLQALAGAALYTMLGLSTSIYLQKITDFVLVDNNLNLLNMMSVIMLVLLVFQLFIGYMKNILLLRSGQQIDARLILGYYNHLLRLPQHFFDSMQTGEIISRINDAVKIRAFINETAISLLVSIFIVLFSFFLMLIYSWKLTLVIAASIPLYLLIWFLTNQMNKRRERKLMEDSASLESQLVESVNSVRTIKEFGLETYADLKTEIRFIQLLRSIYRSTLNALYSSTATELIGRIFVILLLWVGSILVISREITPGELLSFYALAGYFSGPAATLIGMNKPIQNALIAADRLFEIMDLERDTDENKMELPKGLTGDIRFQEITFGYGTRTNIFDNFSFTMKQGTISALVGESGSGKTTLVALLQKIYPLNGGKITIGEVNIDFLSRDSLCRTLSAVPQKPDLFSGSLLENIAVGDHHPDLSRILKICRELGMQEFLDRLPSGFNSWIGGSGQNLSGGEKQRIAIARALYRDPDILLFDEATSALDNEAEHFIQQTILRLREEGKTILIIAHRLSTVVLADNIALLEKGGIVETGTHQSLWQLKGKYYKMWLRQMPFLPEGDLLAFQEKSLNICNETI
ncbi:MAG: peptidase domain-containing ABC transporter [Marinilabiliales bacterium]|nr:peptidase domain-containing ABC transporter [Marinilabiliales bacterium]